MLEEYGNGSLDSECIQDHLRTNNQELFIPKLKSKRTIGLEKGGEDPKPRQDLPIPFYPAANTLVGFCKNSAATDSQSFDRGENPCFLNPPTCSIQV
jgi:hypothetical protein